MKLTIHRGINQIGGCITEIATDNTRILIDLGQNLPDGEGKVDDRLANPEAVEKLTKGIDAIFYTHYHGDHLGLFNSVPEGIPQYLGAVAKRVELCKQNRLALIPGQSEKFKRNIQIINSMPTLEAEKTVQIGDISVTPYWVCHSAYEAFMFVIEANGYRILHTGDFREHGYLGKGLIPTIKKLILPKGKIDFLITEGTMLSRLDERVRNENEIQQEIKKLMKQHKYVFVLCSSTDLERLASYHAANKAMRNRPFVCDDYQKDVLSIFSETAGKESPLFNFGTVYNFWEANNKLVNWMKNSGFCMLVRATEKYNNYLNILLPMLEKEQTLLIYSMWKEYLEPKSRHAKKDYLDFAARFPKVEKLHTSGHASAECLAEVCNLVNPTHGIIPIHSEDSEQYKQLPIRDDLKKRIITSSIEIDGVRIEINHSK